MRFFQIDAFADRAFGGNPACVCLLDTWAGARATDDARRTRTMQAVAAEMNLSETAFVEAMPDGFGLRWFTPVREVGLCGHATLATAHALWEQGHLAPGETARFVTNAGALSAVREGGWIALELPMRAVAAAAPYPALNRALGIAPLHTAIARRPGGDTYLLELASEEEVRALSPDFRALAASDARVTIVTARAEGAGYDFVSRFFAPAIGIDEDPVTGAAHCYLAPYWTPRLGKADLIGYQASARGGIVGCRWQGERVILRGRAITVLAGEIVVELPAPIEE